MRAIVLASCPLAGAVPATAQAPQFWVGVVCEGAMPIGVHIVARAPGETAILVSELLEFCAAQVPAEPKACERKDDKSCT